MSEGIAIPSASPANLGATRHTPVKNRQPQAPSHHSTEPKRSSKSRRQDVHYASDGAVQNSPTKHHSPPDGSTVPGQPRGPRRKPKANKPYQPQYLSETDSFLSQTADGVNDAQTFPITPIKQAYAGPTFHASPAASSLPMPKFFSKSVPPTTPGSGLQAKLEAEEESAQPPMPDTERPNGQPPLSITPIQREASPLDVFFNAQRAEHMRKQSLHSPIPPSPLSTSRPSTQSPQTLMNPYPNPSYRPTQTPTQTPKPRAASGKGVFMMELDGVDDEEQDDSESATTGITPFRDKISSQRSAPRLSATDRAQQDDDLYRQAQSQALKRLLMTGTDKGSNGKIEHFGEKHHMRQSSAPTGTPTLTSSTGNESESLFAKKEKQASRQPDIRSMENDLRRILKLEPNSN